MVKLILLTLFCVLLAVENGVCQDRITISQLLSFLDRIAVNLKTTRDSITLPNNLRPMKFQPIFETPRLRSIYNSLPQSIKDLLKSFIPPTTPAPSTATPTITSTPSTASSTITPTPPTASPTITPTTASNTPPGPETPTPSDGPSSSSTTEPTTQPSPSSTSPTTTTVSTTGSVKTTNAETTMSSETTPDNTSTTGDPPERSLFRRSSPIDVIAEDYNIDTSKLAAWFLKNEKQTRGFSNFLKNVNHTDQDKLTEILNDFTQLANIWGPGFTLYKVKLETFESFLSSDFPSSILERLKARLLVKPVQVAKRYIISRTKRIVTKAKKYRAGLQDSQIMDNIIVLLEAVLKLPDLLIKSLIG